MKKSSNIKYQVSSIEKVSLWTFFVLLAYVPFHILLSTWFGSYFHILEATKVFKDVLLFVGTLTALIAATDKPGFKALFRDKILWLIGFYALLTLIMAAFKKTDGDAEALAIVYNLRFLLFFFYAMLLSLSFKADWMLHYAVRVVLGAGLAVLVFGIIQYLWLPNDALTHIGYSRANGVLPAFFIDNKPDLERAMSTLRDPNSFGSYILIIGALALTYYLRVKNKDLKNALLGYLALCLLGLAFSYSRGAWVGAVFTILAVGYLEFMRRGKRVDASANKLWIAAAAIAGVLLLGGVYAARDSYLVKNIVFHADESTVLEDPNELRVRFVQESLESAVDNPIGYGPGTAGLASIRNNVQGVVLNENYYLQILHEVGVLGVGLFLAILFIAAKRLYEMANGNTVAAALLASFVGLAVTNLLVHIWSNETIAYTWWGLAGLVIALWGNSNNKNRKKKLV